MERCNRCEGEVPLREDEYDCCDICQDCYDEITNRRKNVLKNTWDAVGYINGIKSDDEKLKMSAFLHIFHPELPVSKRDELIRNAT